MSVNTISSTLNINTNSSANTSTSNAGPGNTSTPGYAKSHYPYTHAYGTSSTVSSTVGTISSTTSDGVIGILITESNTQHNSHLGVNNTGATAPPIATQTPAPTPSPGSKGTGTSTSKPSPYSRKSGGGPVPTRPSLSAQLATISANAEAITQDIRAKAGMSPYSSSNSTVGTGNSSTVGADPYLLLSMPAKCFTVGTLNCKYPSPVRFFPDRLEYTFHHPFEASEINMIMSYRDMSSFALNSPAATRMLLSFRVPRRLTHFSNDFDPSNPMHNIVIELASQLAVNQIKEKIIPIIPSASSSSHTQSPMSTSSSVLNGRSLSLRNR